MKGHGTHFLKPTRFLFQLGLLTIIFTVDDKISHVPRQTISLNEIPTDQNPKSKSLRVSEGQNFWLGQIM